MRRIRSVGEAAVPDWVQREARRFIYPDFDTQAPSFPPGGGGGDPTVLVAASDATDLSKSKADFVCTGVNDEGVIISAIDLILSGGPSQGGRVVLSEGNFHVDPATPIALTDKIHLHGLGTYRTWIVAANVGTATDFLVTMQTDSEVSRLGFNTQGVAYVGSVIDCDFGRVADITHFGPAATGIYFSGGQTPNSNIELGGTYSVAGIHVDGIRVKLDNTIINTSAGAGPRILIDNTASEATVITNLTIINSAGGLGNGIETDGADVIIDGFQISTPGSAGIHINDGAPVSHVITNGIIVAETGILMDGSFPSLDHSVISNLAIFPTGVGLKMYALRRCVISDVAIYDAGEHGISLGEFSVNNQIQNNLIYRPGRDTDNTFDGIILVDNADRNYIHGNEIIGTTSGNQPRYGVDVAAATCDCNIVVGNALGPVADYGTDALNDAGTDTQLFWPNDATYGDNFTDCPTSPTSP